MGTYPYARGADVSVGYCLRSNFQGPNGNIQNKHFLLQAPANFREHFENVKRTVGTYVQLDSR